MSAHPRADLPEPSEVEARITRQLRTLAVALHAKHFTSDAPRWRPLEDAEGILSQIDNMTTALARPAALLAREVASYRLLTKRDVIQTGDEVISDDTLSWLPLAGWEVGMAYRPDVFQPARRRLPNRADATQNHKGPQP